MRQYALFAAIGLLLFLLLPSVSADTLTNYTHGRTMTNGPAGDTNPAGYEWIANISGNITKIFQVSGSGATGCRIYDNTTSSYVGGANGTFSGTVCEQRFEILAGHKYFVFGYGGTFKYGGSALVETAVGNFTRGAYCNANPCTGYYFDTNYRHLTGFEFEVITAAPPAGNATTNISFVNRTPTDIVSTSLFSSNATFTYLYNITGLRTPFLAHYINSTILSCVRVLNGSCLLANNAEQTVTGDNSTATNVFSVGENNVYPSIENSNTSLAASNVFNITGTNTLLADAYDNITVANSYLFYEVQLNATTPVSIYYYNQSYAFSGHPSTDSNVYLLATINASPYNHSHTATNWDSLIGVRINGSGYIGTVKATQSGGFIIEGTTSGVRLYGYTGASRVNVSRYSSNNGNSWTAQAFTIRSHVHQFSGNDSFCWNGKGNYTTGSNPQANGTLCDNLDVGNYSPLPPVIYAFDLNNVTGIINVTFNRSLPQTDGATVGQYALYVQNESGAVTSIATRNATVTGNYALHELPYTYNGSTTLTAAAFSGFRIRATEQITINGVYQDAINGNNTFCFAKAEENGTVLANGTYDANDRCLFNSSISLSPGSYVWVIETHPGGTTLLPYIDAPATIDYAMFGFHVDDYCRGIDCVGKSNNRLMNTEGFILNITSSYSYQYSFAGALLRQQIYTLTITAKDTNSLTGTTITDPFTVYGDAYLNLSLRNAYTNASISGFSGWYYDFNASANYSFNSSGTNASKVQIVKGNLYGLYLEHPSYSITASNYQNYTTANTTNAYTFRLYTNNSVLCTVYNQITGALIVTPVTLNVLSDTYTQTYDITNGTTFIDGLIDDTYTFRFSAENYSTNSYYVTVADRSTQTLNAYLGINGSYVVMRVLKAESLETIYGAVVTQYRAVNGSNVVIESKSTDISGRAQFGYIPLQRYTFVVQATGYSTSAFTLDPVLFSSYDVPLTLNASSFSSSVSFADVNIVYAPRYFSSVRQNNFTIYYTAASGDFSSYNVSLAAPGYAFTDTDTNAGGGTLATAFNITGATKTDTVNLTYCYKKVSFDPVCVTYHLEITGVTGNNTLVNLKDGFRYGMDIGDTTIISTILIIIISGVAVAVAGATAGGFVAIALMYIFLFMGFLPVWGVIIGTIVGFFIIANGGGR